MFTLVVFVKLCFLLYRCASLIMEQLNTQVLRFDYSGKLILTLRDNNFMKFSRLTLEQTHLQHTDEAMSCMVYLAASHNLSNHSCRHSTDRSSVKDQFVMPHR